MRTPRPLVAAFDLLCALLLVFVILALIQTTRKPPSITTYGQYAVTTHWADNSNDDVDLYVRIPRGNIVFFANTSVGLVNLEHDDLGTALSGTDQGVVTTVFNGERTIIRGLVPGEYTCNLHMYRKAEPGPTAVTVELWSLRGEDRELHRQQIVLADTGSETTAFRFTITPAGEVANINRLQARLVGLARAAA